jgi:drug/metabolite transporter (DMT)-like permease
MNKSTVKYVLLFVTVTMIWGSSFLCVNVLVHSNTPVLLLTSLRFAVGSMALIVFRAISKNKTRFITREWIYGGGLGIVIFVAFAFQTYGAYYTTPSKNGMLTGLYVIIVPLLLIALSRKIKIKPIIDAVICIAGMVVLFNIFNETTSINIGDILTIFCAIAFSVQYILLERHSPKFNALNYTIAQLVCVTLLAIMGSLIFEQGDYSTINIQTTAVLLILYLGLFSTGYAYVIQTIVQAKLPATTVAVLSCLEAVFAVTFSLWLGYEMVSMHLILGSLIILLAMVSAVAISKKNV